MKRSGKDERTRSSRPVEAKQPLSSPAARDEKSRRRWAWGGGLLLITLGVAWWGWPRAPEKTAAPALVEKSAPQQRPRIKRQVNVTLAPSPTPGMIQEPQASAPLSLEPVPRSGSPELAEPPAELEERVLWVSVVDVRGRLIPNAVVESEDCRFFRRAPEGEVEVVVHEDACTLQGGRRDGALTAWGDPVFVDMSQQFEQRIRLEVPVERTAGMGLQVVPEEGGILVLRVLPGSPAEKAGLEAGDLITVVDGVSTAGMPVREFVDLGTGPINTEVKLSMVRRSEAGVAGQDLTLVRQFIE
ncbi:MAG: S41 family peptidase [Myxococcota bacterium]